MDAGNAITIAIPTIAVMFGVLLNRQDATAIRGEISQLRAEFKADIAQVRNEMVLLRNTIHADMVSLHERIAVVEAKQSNQ